MYVAMLPGGYRQAGASVVEGDRWMVSLMGLAGVQAPGDLERFRHYARSLWASDIYDIVSKAEPLGDATTGAYPANVWRRYDRLRQLPSRLVVLGDALCTTNPHYVRGMSMATLEALTLGRVLDWRGPETVGAAFFRATRPLIDAQWDFVTTNDLLQPAIKGPRSPRWRLVTAYLRRVLPATHRDPVVAKAFMDVFGMRASPMRLLRPDTLARTLLGRAHRRSDGGRSPASGVRAGPDVFGG